MRGGDSVDGRGAVEGDAEAPSAPLLVPDLRGRSCPEARAALAQQNWSVRPVRWRIANAWDFGKVVDQGPAGGRAVAGMGEIRVDVAGPVARC